MLLCDLEHCVFKRMAHGCKFRESNQTFRLSRRVGSFVALLRTNKASRINRNDNDEENNHNNNDDDDEIRMLDGCIAPHFGVRTSHRFWCASFKSYVQRSTKCTLSSTTVAKERDEAERRPQIDIVARYAQLNEAIQYFRLL